MGKRRKRKTGRRRKGSKKRREVLVPAEKPAQDNMDGLRAGSMTSQILGRKK